MACFKNLTRNKRNKIIRHSHVSNTFLKQNDKTEKLELLKLE